jgi:hypothetical protein
MQTFALQNEQELEQQKKKARFTLPRDLLMLTASSAAVTHS